MTTRHRTIASLLFLAVISSGCASQPIFPPLDPPLYWPQGVDPARFAYVGQISGEADLRRSPTPWEWVTDLLGGAEPPAEIRSAAGVAVTAAGVLFVTDSQLALVHRFDLENREYRALADAGEGRRFVTPMGLALAGNKLLVTDRSLQTVTVLSTEGEPEAVIGAGALESPVGVAVGPSGRVYVADVTAHQVKVFERDGELAFSVGRRGGRLGEFNFPTHVACDAGESLYVSDTLNSRVQVFDRDGRFLRSWGQKGDGPGDFSQPKGIACDRRGYTYVVDSHFENVQVFSSEGELLLPMGREGTGPGEFWLPVGVFVDPLDRIWVSDSYNRRVQVFQYLEVQPEGVTP